MTLSLTGIRGAAVLLVMLSHASDLRVNPWSGINFLGAGRYGVFLFFVLSAFLLTRQFFDRSVWDGRLHTFLHRYFRRRFMRIFPLFSVALLIYFLLQHEGHPIYPIDGAMVLKSLFLLDAKGIFWTIPVEFEYYFLLPVVALIFVRFDRAVIVVAGTLAMVLLWSRFFPPVYEPDVLPFVPVFLLGSLSAYVSRALADADNGRDFQWLFEALAWGSAFCIIMQIPFFFHAATGWPVGTTTFHDHFLRFGFLSSGWILGALHGAGGMRRLLESRVLIFWGEVSFSAYLGHMVVLKSVHHFLPGLPVSLQWMLFVGLTALLAWLSFRFFELPLSRWRPSLG